MGVTIHVAVDRMMSEGNHSFIWSPEGLSEGIYYTVTAYLLPRVVTDMNLIILHLFIA